MSFDLLPETLAELPLFPLHQAVLFPGMLMPLHVFEPRYRAMIADALNTDNLIGVVMLQEGADPMAAQAPIHPVACAGRIVHDEKLDNGRYNILVHGIDRVRLNAELPLTPGGYRRFDISPFGPPSPDCVAAAQSELVRLQSCILSLRSAIGQRDQQLVEVLSSTADPLALADILSAVMVNEPHDRQALLELGDLKRRLGMLIDLLAEAMIHVGEPPVQAKLN